MPDLASLRAAIRDHQIADEAADVARLKDSARLDPDQRRAISTHAAAMVRSVRDSSEPGVMESFLAEYGLSTKEGIALMCLAEALLRVPDAHTIDALIEDKIAPSEWGAHLGHSSSSLVNASTWALMLTGKVLEDDDGEGLAGLLRGAVRRLGEPVIRRAVAAAMRELGQQFVLGETIGEAMKNALKRERDGYSYSYDMLGEAARTDADARRYHLAYSRAISAIADASAASDVRDNPGVSVKLSALHPRYEYAQKDRVMSQLLPRARSLAALAASANMGFNIDAEEADRLDLSLDVIEALLSDDALAGWDGFGVVVQAYGPRAPFVIDWLQALAEKLDRRLMVRLVKGAYWDAEIKRAQVLGLPGFPVFTRKAATDVSYISCARRLLDADRLYPQFATHNAHTAAAVLAMAGGRPFEFQRLHGMGERLHEVVRDEAGGRCRIYAPVGAHEDLLAYLVRRLLENGANSSFVHQIVDESVSAEEIARDPFEAETGPNPVIRHPSALFGEGRRNSLGWDLADPLTLARIEEARAPFRDHRWSAGPIIAGATTNAEAAPRRNPANPEDVVGHAADATPENIEAALAAAGGGFAEWSALPAADRAAILRRAADLYEANAPELFALACREAGKTLADCVGEVREAVDFLRYYAAEAERADLKPRGVFTCISPWNFPLAIFTGQVSAALAVGCAVLAKPAEQTPLIAARATQLLHEAGVPRAALQLLPGDGPSVGAPLTSDPRVAGVCFTGGTDTARLIERAMAEHLAPDAPLIAETGGLNAMIVDSTALPEQAVRDILASAFQSAGQRCSALRVLYVQREAAERLTRMLTGAMNELRIGDPWNLSTDIGPVIDAEARGRILAHCEANEIAHRLEAPANGTFAATTLIPVPGIGALKEEIFGPVLHLAPFEAERLAETIDEINATGYGLTFGLHTRIDDRVQTAVERIRAGNSYVNRNQIGAVVGSQPFGGEGLSGTGPKAGGPHYLRRFAQEAETLREAPPEAPAADPVAIATALARLSVANRPVSSESLPGSTGESNRLSLYPRGVVLCLGPTLAAARAQAAEAAEAGAAALTVAPGGEIDGLLEPEALATLPGFDAVVSYADETTLAALRRALAARTGPIIPLVTARGSAWRLMLERHVCIDTTAAGGNATLLAETAGV